MPPSTASRPAAPRARRHLAALLALALAGQPLGSGALAQPPHGDPRNTLPALGDSESEDFPVATERRLGERIMRDLRRDRDYLDDPLLLGHLAPMWAGLLAAARARGHVPAELSEHFSFEMFLVRDRSVNAFALPGGYVGLHLGLIAITVTPDELASVLAHELSHVTQRHIARSVGAGRSSSVLGIAGLILGALAASRSPEAANALITGGQAVAVQGQLNFSREAEREADRIGFGMLSDAGHAPAGMASMFEKLLHAARLNDSQNFPYLRTHPLTTDRLGEARTRAGNAAPAPVRPPAYALMQARARVLMDPRQTALQQEQGLDDPAVLAALAGPTERLAALYASAMASLLRRDAARADAALAQARLLAAGDPAARNVLDLLALQNAAARGDAGRATALLDALQRDPADTAPRALLMAEAQVALLPGARRGALEAAAGRLQTQVAAWPGDALAWGTLAQVWHKLAQPLRAVRAEAEARAALGDTQGAVDRLRAARRLAADARGNDFIEASVIESRLRVLEAQRRTFAAEAREGS